MENKVFLESVQHLYCSMTPFPWVDTISYIPRDVICIEFSRGCRPSEISLQVTPCWIYLVCLIWAWFLTFSTPQMLFYNRLSLENIHNVSLIPYIFTNNMHHRWIFQQPLRQSAASQESKAWSTQLPNRKEPHLEVILEIARYVVKRHHVFEYGRQSRCTQSQVSRWYVGICKILQTQTSIGFQP